MIERLFRQPITIQLRGVTGTDRYGNETAGVTSTSTVLGYLEQTAATEVVVGRETYLTDALVVLPAGTPLEASSVIACDAKSYEVVGSVGRPFNPRTRSEHHVEARLRRTEG